MSTPMSNSGAPSFYTVHEAAEVLRVNPSTLYQSIREGAFPAVRIRTRYVIPAVALSRIIDEVTDSGGVVDPADLIARNRNAHQVRRLVGGESL